MRTDCDTRAARNLEKLVPSKLFLRHYAVCYDHAANPYQVIGDLLDGERGRETLLLVAAESDVELMRARLFDLGHRHARILTLKTYLEDPFLPPPVLIMTILPPSDCIDPLLRSISRHPSRAIYYMMGVTMLDVRNWYKKRGWSLIELEAEG